MMKESFIKVDDGYIYMRRNRTFIPYKKTLLFIHGLGESGLCFKEVLEDERFNKYNILIPDLIGYGRSSDSRSGDYSFASHVKMMFSLIDTLSLNEIFLVGHSMGGDITTLLCSRDLNRKVKKYINIEGDITQHDLFVSSKAVEADGNNCFPEWFESYKNETIFNKYAQKYASGKRLFASLWFCRPDAFLENAYELVERNTKLEGEYKSEIGKLYCDIKIPKVFCYGSESLSEGSGKYLEDNNLKFKKFTGVGHFPMIDKAKDFYNFVDSFIS
ncbi:MAG: alpha/beta hydrolase [Desulfobacterales bacterium]|nr:alpha/beta hydrolase [Desulfobacterales bacterium]